jgi:signal peptidase I
MQLLQNLSWRYLLLAALAGCVTTYTAYLSHRYRTYYIPSESMLPTFEVNDRILAERASYSNTFPQRGDIVIFRPSERLTEMLQGAMPIDAKTVFVKRVIGLPGEVIEVRQGHVYINQQHFFEPYLTEAARYNWGPITVPPDAVILLGDNRNNAFDSHYWGALPQKNLLGRVIWRYWPLGRFGAIPPIDRAMIKSKNLVK